MKELRLKKLTRARMEQWLRENPNATFYTRNARLCPIANFIRKIYPSAKFYTVGADEGKIETKASKGKMVRFHLPQWALVFINKVDALSNTSVSITGRRALELLTSI